MPRYHFNIDGHDYEPDQEGTELSDIVEARAQAVMFAGACVKDDPELITKADRFQIKVTTDDDRPLFTVVVAIEDGSPS